MTWAHDDLLVIAGAARLIEKRELSPVELTRALLDRVEALDPQIDAFIEVTADHALRQARVAEREIGAGRYRGPLHGIPFGLKDIFWTRGIRTTCHSKICVEHVPHIDATVVSKLYDAGGILLGKMATHEFAHGGPSFDLPWSPARNPWNRDHFTGGSSSGPAAGVAAGFVLGAMGSDTGGSIRSPAALCGVVGLKPTYGIVSRYGMFANSFTYDTAAPITRTVEDCAIMMGAVAGHDPKDPASSNEPLPDYRGALTPNIDGLRIGVLRHLYEVDVKTPEVVIRAVDSALEVLTSLGAVAEDVVIRPAQEYLDVKATIAESELFAVHEHDLRERPGAFGVEFLRRVLGAVLIKSSDYVQAMRQQRVLAAELAQIFERHRYDVLLSAGPGPAPGLGQRHPINFGTKASLTIPFNVSGGPAIVQCISFTDAGLPLAMQIAGPPFADDVVMRVAHAYELATPWRLRRPTIDPHGQVSTESPPTPQPDADDLTPAQRDALAKRCKEAGLRLSEDQFRYVCSAAPYVEAMTGRLRRQRDFTEQPMSTVRFPPRDVLAENLI